MSWSSSADEGLLDELKAEVRRLKQALGEYGEHDPGCPKRYVQEQFCASLKTEGVCECGLDEELGLTVAASTRERSDGP